MKRLMGLGLIFLGACQGASSGEQSTKELAAAQERQAFAELPEADSDDVTPSFAEGNILGHAFSPTTHIFVAGVVEMGESLPVMALVQSDHPDICKHLQAGTMPKDASLFAAVLLQVDGQSFRTQKPYPAEGHLGRDPEPYAMGHFRHLDSSCAITPPGEAGAGVSLTQGSVVLRQYIPSERAVADYALALPDEAQTLRGHIDATFCDAPAFFEQPEIFLSPVAPQQCG